MRSIPEAVRRRVIRRAQDRCEYCGFSQEGQEAAFRIDHIILRSAGGKMVPENLALACVSGSLCKAARQTALDPQSGTEVSLYNPRRGSWHEHFHWEGFFLIGQTAIGRATVEALRMNRPLILAIRREETAIGRHPPSERFGQ